MSSMTWQYSGGRPRAGDSHAATDQLDPDDRVEDYDDDYNDGVVYYDDSSRWRWVAAVAGIVLVLAVIGAFVILRGGDTATTTGRIAPSTSAPVATRPSTTPPRPAATTPSTPLAPETVTTVTPTATSPTQTAPPPTTSESDPRTVTYVVSGTQQPGDIVTVTYIDGTGVPRTDFNVMLPWTKTVAGDMLLKSVTAVSLMSHLNCSIMGPTGQAVTTQNFNTIATTCNR